MEHTLMGAGTVTDNTNKNEKIEDVCTLSPEFCRKIYTCKKVLYNDIVFSAKNVESDEAQNNNLLQHYLNALNYIYHTTFNIINNNIKAPSEIGKGYSSTSKRTINDTTDFMNTFFKNNNNYNSLLYIDYITNKLIVFPFIQRRDFPV
jgi:hypothetical protein